MNSLDSHCGHVSVRRRQTHDSEIRRIRILIDSGTLDNNVDNTCEHPLFCVLVQYFISIIVQILAAQKKDTLRRDAAMRIAFLWRLFSLFARPLSLTWSL